MNKCPHCTNSDVTMMESLQDGRVYCEVCSRKFTPIINKEHRNDKAEPDAEYKNKCDEG